MPFDPKRTRRIFLAIAIALFAVVLGFYSYARWKVNRALSKLPEKLGVEVQQSTAGFTFTKSENGRKQFSISADKAIQYKAGQKASLRNVRIIVYGRTLSGATSDNVYDQIFGDEFEYDPQTGDVRANGVVDIDLEHHGEPSAEPMQPHAEAGSIHLRTSGLVFNQKTGIAQTKEKIEFSLPQATGSAVGAHYDSKEMRLTLLSDVNVTTAVPGANKKTVGSKPAHIQASKAVITDSPRRADLSNVTVRQGTREMTSSEVNVFLRSNSAVDHIEASSVDAKDSNPQNPAAMRANNARFLFSEANRIEAAVLTGNVALQSSGMNDLNGAAGRADIAFGAGGVVRSIRATNRVTLSQTDRSGATHVLNAPAVELAMADNALQSANTVGPSQVTISQGQTKTVITADRFDASFASGNRIQSLRGGPNAKVVMEAAGNNPKRVTTSEEAVARFTANRRGTQIEAIEQSGNFRYTEGLRKASAERARYVPAQETIVASGNPRFEDSAAGLALSADTLRFHRRNNSVEAEGSVKTTYLSQSAQKGGALLGAAEPVHVTSARATASTAGKAHFEGNARLWQGASTIEAAALDFDRGANTVIASSLPSNPVRVNFTQADPTGKPTPVIVAAGKLSYNDAQRRAVFTQNVRASGQEVTMTARQMDVLLKPRSSAAAPSAAGQLDRIIASGSVQLEQRNPLRKGSGDKLTYFADNAKFVLTASAGETCSIFDAEHGEIQANSLTFFSRDDTVQVGSGENARVVTKTRIKEDSRP